MTDASATDEQLRALFAAIDRKDTEGFVDFLTDDATLRFGSSPAVSGSDAIRALVAGFFEAVHALRHVVRYAVEDHGRLICEGEVTYERHDGSAITLPFANVMEYADGGTGARRFRHYKVYADYGPLWAGAE
jgi:ketosteroid isomerase-like protein